MKQGRNVNDFFSVTEILVIAQSIFGFFAHFANILSVGPNFVPLGYLIAVCPLIFVGVWLFKVSVDFVNRKLKVEDLTKYRNDYLIGFGTIGMCAVVFEVAVFCVTLSEESNIFAPSIYVFTTSSIYYFFVFPTFDKKCTWIPIDQETCVQYIFIVFYFFHFGFSLNSFKFAVKHDKNKLKTLLFYQYWCNIALFIAFAEFARVLCDGVQLINVNGGRNDVAALPVESSRGESITKPVAPKPNCNICSFPYTETGIHTPRILLTCGHTICEQCASKLLNARVQNFLICPFCQKPTVVNGTAGSLPKNYALLEYRRDVVQQ